jgi:hypothetical protein
MRQKVGNKKSVCCTIEIKHSSRKNPEALKVAELSNRIVQLQCATQQQLKRIIEARYTKKCILIARKWYLENVKFKCNVHGKKTNGYLHNF